MCRTESAAREALRRIGLVMDRLGLTLHPAKTRLVDLRRGKEGFVFLGCMIRKRRSIQRNPRWHFMQRWPSPKATKKLRERVREITSQQQSGKDIYFYDYRTNVPLYPEFQKFFRKNQPPTLIVWGKNDFIFPPEGAAPYSRDLKNLETHLLDTGHFALETHSEEIASLIETATGGKKC